MGNELGNEKRGKAENSAAKHALHECPGCLSFKDPHAMEMIMNVKSAVIPVEMIEKAILFIRNQRVMLDTDLAALYGVQTKVLNQAVKRNERRFPSDFVFFLTKEEKDELVTNCDRLRRMRHSSALPRAFTEQGVAMLSSVLNSERAVDVNIHPVK